MRRAFVLTAILMLAGCSALSSPAGILMSGDVPPVVPIASDAPGRASEDDPFTIATRPDGDPRAEAGAYCSKRSRYAQLIKAQRDRAADPANETITWYFQCRI